MDEQFGSGVIRSAKQEAMILAIPIEASGQSWFTPQWGDAWLAHIERIAPDYEKVLVRDNPDLPPIDGVLSLVTSPRSALPSAR